MGEPLPQPSPPPKDGRAADVTLPTEIVCNPAYSPNAVRVLMVIAAYDRGPKTEGCTISKERIAREAGISSRSVQRLTPVLVDLGLIYPPREVRRAGALLYRSLRVTSLVRGAGAAPAMLIESNSRQLELDADDQGDRLSPPSGRDVSGSGQADSTQRQDRLTPPDVHDAGQIGLNGDPEDSLSPRQANASPYDAVVVNKKRQQHWGARLSPPVFPQPAIQLPVDDADAIRLQQLEEWGCARDDAAAALAYFYGLIAGHKHLTDPVPIRQFYDAACKRRELQKADNPFGALRRGIERGYALVAKTTTAPGIVRGPGTSPPPLRQVPAAAPSLVRDAIATILAKVKPEYHYLLDEIRWSDDACTVVCSSDRAARLVRSRIILDAGLNVEVRVDD